jgi:hypothetical protein
MATQTIPTYQRLNGPVAVSTLSRGPVSRQPRSCHSVHTKGCDANKQDQNWQDLVVEMLPLVKRLAFKIRQRLPSHVEMEDLVANGVLGLVDAMRKFDGTKRVKLESYARRRSDLAGHSAQTQENSKGLPRSGGQARPPYPGRGDGRPPLRNDFDSGDTRVALPDEFGWGVSMDRKCEVDRRLKAPPQPVQ